MLLQSLTISKPARPEPDPRLAVKTFSSAECGNHELINFSGRDDYSSTKFSGRNVSFMDTRNCSLQGKSAVSKR